MVRCLALIHLTDKGIREIDHSTQRAAAFATHVETAGGKVTGQYWSIGKYDGALVFEVPDERTATSLLLKLAHEGYVRTTSQRLFNTEEFQAILTR